MRLLFEQQKPRMGGALWVSMATHLAAAALVFLVVRYVPEEVYEAILPERLPEEIVWLVTPGPGGGGGGGGDPKPLPPKKVEVKGEQQISTPVTPPPEPEPVPEPTPEPPPPVEQTIAIPAQQMAAAPTTSPGTLDAQAGSTGGAGSGPGTGAGSGRGSGLGPGSGGGTGGGVYRPGSGVSFPKLVQQVRPNYTVDAMRAKVQGEVTVECVVLADGTVGAVEVVKSLDSVFGLDQEAIKAAKKWRFSPAIHQQTGQPVPVLIQIVLAFSIR